VVNLFWDIRKQRLSLRSRLLLMLRKLLRKTESGLRGQSHA